MVSVTRTPLEIKELNGAFIHNPNRKPRGRPPKNPQALGEPPAYLTKAEQIIWAELQYNAPATVLTRADRHQIEIVCQLMAKFRAREATAAEIGHLLKSLSACGFNPVDRQRVATIPEAKIENPFSEFTQ
jgi:hypothetical protein